MILPMQIDKLLPQKTKCNKCGYWTCRTFSFMLADRRASLDLCPELDPEVRKTLEFEISQNERKLRPEDMVGRKVSLDKIEASSLWSPCKEENFCYTCTFYSQASNVPCGISNIKVMVDLHTKDERIVRVMCQAYMVDMMGKGRWWDGPVDRADQLHAAKLIDAITDEQNAVR